MEDECGVIEPSPGRIDTELHNPSVIGVLNDEVVAHNQLASNDLRIYPEVFSNLRGGEVPNSQLAGAPVVIRHGNHAVHNTDLILGVPAHMDTSAVDDNALIGGGQNGVLGGVQRIGHEL